MARRESSPGFGARIERVRARLEMSPRVFMGYFGGDDPKDRYVEGAFRNWKKNDASPGAYTLKRGFVRMNVRGVPDLLSWLADGDGEPPAWLDDRTLNPFMAPEGSPDPSTPAGGTKITEAIRSATATVFGSASWAPATIRLAQLARQSQDAAEVESIRAELVQLLEGVAQRGRAAAFYGAGRLVGPFVTASTAVTASKTVPRAA